MLQLFELYATAHTRSNINNISDATVDGIIDARVWFWHSKKLVCMTETFSVHEWASYSRCEAPVTFQCYNFSSSTRLRTRSNINNISDATVDGIIDARVWFWHSKKLVWMTETFSVHEWASYSRCEAPVTFQCYNFSSSTRLTRSQGRFIGSKGTV